jgi:hypothetical protein
MKLFYACAFLILFFLIIPCGNATEEMAEKTGKDCSYCHLDQSGGGELTKAGKEYLTEDAKVMNILKAKAFYAIFALLQDSSIFLQQFSGSGLYFTYI